MSSAIWDPVETISRDEMAALQAERLRDCLARLVERVPFYRESLGAMDIAPEDVRSPGDLAGAALYGQAGPAGQLSLRAFRRVDG